jgi:type IV pilus assembly protein PilB
MSTFNRRLKQILAKSGSVPFDKLEEAFQTAETQKVSLVEMLGHSGLVESSTVLGLISREIGFPPIDLHRLTPDEDIDQVFPAELARKYGVCPISKIGPCLTVAMPDPFDIVKIDQLRLETRCEIRPVVALDVHVADLLRKIYDRGVSEMASLLEGMHEDEVELKASEFEDDNTLDIQEMSEGSPAVKLVNLLIYQGIRDRASDIHIEPFEKTIRVRYRLDGVCKEVLSPPKNLQSAIVSRIKIMAGLDIAERRKPQDGKFQVKVEGRQVDFRVSTLPMVHGEKAVLRILDAGNLALNLDSLGFEPSALTDYRGAISQPYGMILITGPTGSGKSTTLYSALKEIYSPEINFVTVEDPVEYQLEGINQVPVNPKRELTFAAALRSILRQDPDVIMIGEIRDRETIEIAVKAALTGHLVLSTLHTNDAASAVTRMVDMGLDPFLVSSSVLLICAQRLARKLCDQCKQPVDVPRDRLLNMGFREEDFEEEFQLYRPGEKGCSRCANGYKGRFALLETLPMQDSLRRAIVEGASAIRIKDIGIENGMISLRRAAILNARRGKTSLEEVMRVTIGD